MHPDPYNPVLLAPELEVSLSVALTLSSSTQSLPRRVDIRCSPERRRCSLPANLPGSPWFLLLVLCGDVETNPGPVCGCQHPSRRCDKVPSFTFTHLNVRSLFRHLDQVTEFAETASPDILALSETWLDSSVDDSMLFIPGFTIHRADRHRHGGGVCIYVCNSLTCRKVSISNNSSTSSVESIWLEVHSRSVPSKILVGCIYRPPSLGMNSVQFLLDMIDHTLTLQDHVVVYGDLNINLLDPDHPQSILLSEFIKSRNLLQPIASPTRITCNSATLLDIFLVSSERIVRSSHVVDIGISDHSAISLGLCWSKPKPRSSTVLRRSFKRFDSDSLRQIFPRLPGQLWTPLTVWTTKLTSSIDYSFKFSMIMPHCIGLG